MSATVRGNRVTVTGVAIGQGGRAEVTLDARVTMAATPGDYVNRARVLDPSTGEPLAPDATATVRVLAAPVFACATVIGRVFDDRNQDGYQNGARDDHAALTEQSYVPAGKLMLDPVAPGGKAGIAGVRLVAPDGLLVTTDAHGRFSIPCAALPNIIGSNFAMKLDARTLPSGFRLTTENPRVVRIDLDARVFLPGGRGTTLRPELEAGLRRMVADIADIPSVLLVTYDETGEAMRTARARVRAVERMLRDLWPGNGRCQLNIEVLFRRTPAGQSEEQR